MAEDAPQPAGLNERVKEVIDGIRPYIQADGGDIDLVGVDDDGTVRVRLRGACVGCPMSAMTLKNGIEQRLRQQVPEVTRVENVSE
jgi:Fe-S cluster biogenesis protein NfuA